VNVASPACLYCRFLVSIVDATASYVKFGLRVSASAQGNMSVISVYYADDRPVPDVTWDSPVSSWTVPSLVGRWTSIVVRAQGPQMSLYVDCSAQDPPHVEVARRPGGLTFDSGSVVYVAQAAPQFGHHFEVCTHCLYLNVVHCLSVRSSHSLVVLLLSLIN